MLLTIVSYNGHALNDSSYGAWFPPGNPSMPGARAAYSPRSRTFPKLSNKTIGEPSLAIRLQCKGTIHTQYETLKSWFLIDDNTPRVLIVKDTSDSDRQWYVMAYPISPVQYVDAGEYSVELAVDEPLWRTVTGQTVNWSITASGQTKALTVLGNQAARLSMAITPSTAKAGGYLYKRFKPWRNPLTVVNGEPLEITGGGLDTNALVADNSNKCQINQGGGIDAVVTTIPFDTVTGTLPNAGMGYCGTEQISWTGKTATDLTGVTRGIGGTTAAVHADNAEIKVSKVLANLNDLRVFTGSTEIDRWHTGLGASTKIWVNLTFQPKIEMQLSGTIAGSGSVTVLNIIKNTTQQALMKRLPAKFMVYIDSEIFYCSNPNPTTYQITVTSRAGKGTSMGAHANLANVVWIEHDLNIVYGNYSAEAPATNDDKKPIFDLSSSTNTSWVYTEFASANGLREGGWTQTLIKKTGPDTYIYTGSHGDMADPVTEMGFAMKSYVLSNLPKPETATLAWKIYHPASFTTVTITGAKRRLKTDWPVDRGLRKSTDGNNWSTVFAEATPSVVSSWESLTSHSGVSLSGNFPYLQWYMNGSITAGTLTVPNEVDLEMQGATLVINSSNVLQAVLSFSEESSYYLDATITVVVSGVDGESLYIQYPMKASETLTVNCDTEECTHNGLTVLPLRFSSIRDFWLDVPAGSTTLRFDDTGTTAVDIVLTWEDKNTL